VRRREQPPPSNVFLNGVRIGLQYPDHAKHLGVLL